MRLPCSEPLNVRSEPLNVRSKPLNGEYTVVQRNFRCGVTRSKYKAMGAGESQKNRM